jgi:hypothetical protein
MFSFDLKIISFLATKYDKDNFNTNFTTLKTKIHLIIKNTFLIKYSIKLTTKKSLFIKTKNPFPLNIFTPNFRQTFLQL